MSLHYLLDGYNIVKQVPAFRDLPLEEGRRGLLRWIDISRPQGSVNNLVTVVFDGHPEHSLFPGTHTGGSQESQGIRVIFSDGCSADDTIKAMVEEDADRKNCVVVSDDKDVFLYARSLGARVMSVRSFTSKPRELHGRQDAGGKYISLSRQEKINKELFQKWLGDKQ
jgi:predicted RNA-binding protein with PIN domain